MCHHRLPTTTLHMLLQGTLRNISLQNCMPAGHQLLQLPLHGTCPTTLRAWKRLQHQPAPLHALQGWPGSISWQ
jgi:hypothetical protein